MSFDGTAIHFSFGIPRGADAGPGQPGSQGPPGEASNQQLNNAVATPARNPSWVTPFSGTFSDPPTQAEMQSFAACVESLRSALER